MKILTISLAAIGAFTLISCVSTQPAPETAYYTLSAPNSSDNAAPHFSIGKIQLADYLETSSLILEIEEAQFRPASYHRWAEPLTSSIRRALENRGAEESSSQVDIVIDKFHGSIDGETFISGSFAVHSHSKRSATRSFSLVSTIKEDGYPAMVGELDSLLGTLRGRISKQISEERGRSSLPSNQKR